MVINVFKAMQYPEEEDVEGYMRIDIIEELIKEVQQDEEMQKIKAANERKDIVQPHEDNNMQQKIEKERQQDNLLQQNIQEGMQQKGELQQNSEESKENQKINLKPLPSTLKYAFLDKEETLP
ncbi:hypothetical protein PIB30_111177, partial [Stylosanthes scabra]|nr:hypothetical protein [Stylosanthes scabra]